MAPKTSTQTQAEEKTVTVHTDATGQITGETATGQSDPSTTTASDPSVDVSRCEDTNDNKRRCVLVRDHDKGESPTAHQYRKTSTTSDVALPDLAALNLATFEDVPDDEAPVPVKEMVRDEAQTTIDERVKAAHAAWIEAGKPQEFNKSPRKRIVIAPEHEAGVRKMLEKAGSYLNLRVRIAPSKTHESGNRMVYYVVTDRTKKADADATAAANGDGTAADDTAANGGQDQEG